MAKQLMDAALSYALLANNNLVTKPLIPASYGDLSDGVKVRVFTDQLIVHFLFPNLNDHQRDLLVALRLQRYGLTLGVNSNPAIRDPEVKLEMSRATDKAEAGFMQLKTLVEQEGMLNSLTVAQREILDGEFFAIPFQDQ